MINFHPCPDPGFSDAAVAHATIERMAHAIVEMEANGRPVTSDALADYGEFTHDEVERHGREARDRAVMIKREGRQAA